MGYRNRQAYPINLPSSVSKRNRRVRKSYNRQQIEGGELKRYNLKTDGDWLQWEMWVCWFYCYIVGCGYMGSYLSRGEEEISESLKEEYDIEAQPYLLHRRTQQLCTLHKITVTSPADSARIQQAVEEYQRTRCESISKLRTYYHQEAGGYCSDEQSYFLVFQGQNNYSLREECAKRRLYRTAFAEQEIQQVAETLLCGLREYDHRFQRDYSRIALDSLVIDQQTHRLYLRDPWLAADTQGQGDPLTSLLTHYPSPEKLRAAHSSKCEDYKEFLSNLFSVGAIALQLKRLQFADAIYLKKREVNYQEVRARVGEFSNERLRRGLECLLDPNPNERKRIYQMWGIENREEHYLEPILTQKEDLPSPIGKIRQEAPVSLSQFQVNEQYHPSTRIIYPGLKPVPSETLIVPPLTIQLNGRAPEVITSGRSPEPLSSRSNRSDYILPHQQQAPQPQAYLPKPTFTIPTSSVHFQPLPPQHFVPFPQQLPSPPLVQFTPKPNQNVPPFQTSTFIGPTLIPPPSFNDIYNRKLVDTQHFNDPKQITSTAQYQVPIYQPPPTVANSNATLSKPQSNGWSFNPLTDYKESMYEPLVRASNEQTVTESPGKEREREIKSIIVEGHENHPIVQPTIEKSPRIIDTILADNIDHHEDSAKEDPIIEERQEEADIAANLINAIQEDVDHPNTFQDNNELPLPKLPDTPNRPTAKNKFNSTIVEVRDEDSPLHSQRSEEALEEEYVVEEYETGSRYQGFKSRGMRNGRGKFYYQDGGYYEGQWRNNKMDGQGRLYYEGGKLAYEGSWAQDEFNGAGKVYNDSPVPLELPFDYSNFELLEDYWEYYEGMLVRDTKQGRGKIKLSNGEVFEGDFHNDRIQGFGKFHTREGKVVEGIWRESKLIKIINTER